MGKHAMVRFAAVAALAMIGAAFSDAEPRQRNPAEERKERKERDERKAAVRAEEVVDIVPPPGETAPADTAALYARITESGNHEVVRLGYQAALTALSGGRRDEAKRVLDGLIGRLESNTSGDASAQKARKMFHEEAEKNFRGEPYEQSAIYLLRGLMYFEEADYENARAVFRSGALRDRSAADVPESEQYNDDLAHMDYLEALCDIKLGDPDAADKLRVAREHARNPGAIIEPSADFNTLVVFLSGDGPKKYRTGQYNQYLRFSPGTGASTPVRMTVGGAPMAEAAGPVDNLSFQASTRGGRQIDAVLKGKAQFKTGASIVGDLALGAGMATMAAGAANNNSGAAGAGAALLVVGLIGKGIAKAANPEADARMLDPIWDDIYIFPATLPEGQHQVLIEAPQYGAASPFNLVRGANPMQVFLHPDRAFGPSAAVRQWADLASQTSTATWHQVWQGNTAASSPQGYVQVPLTLYVASAENGELRGTGVLAGQGLPTTFPFRGALDEKAMRIEYRDNPMGDASQYTMLTGKTSKKGRKASGETVWVGAGSATTIGAFEIELVRGAGAEEAEPAKSSGKDKQSKSRSGGKR